MKTIQVLHIIQHLSRGGAARSLMATAKYSSKLSNIKHTAVSLLPAEPEAIGIAQKSGITILNAPERPTIQTAIEKSDLVQIHFWNNPELYKLLHSNLPAMRLLAWFHVAGDFPPQIVTKQVIDLVDFALASSPYTQDIPVFQGLSPEVKAKKTGMVYDSTDFDRLANFKISPHSTFNVGYIGMVDFVKMHPRYVQMSAKIDVPNVRFLVWGSGGAWNHLRQQAQQLGVAERFEWRGYVEDIRSAIEVFDVFGYPLCENNYSTAELILQEVMYAGIPPVIFAHGGAQRTVIHQQTGLIVRCEKEYKEAIEYLYHHPEERARLGGNAREYAQKYFGAENAAKQLNAIYKKLIQQPKRRRILGVSVGERLLDRPVTLQDLMGTTPSGAELFIESLGDVAPHFSVSLNSQNIQELFDADRQIATSSPIMCNPGGGGVLNYRSHYPNDGYLRLWSGLIFQEKQQYSQAISELKGAIELGCNHWRVSWYLANVYEKVGSIELAKKSVQTVLQTVPNFTEAKSILARLSSQLEKSIQQSTSTLSESLPGLTIFTTTKPFEGHPGMIQRNAVQSWTMLNPKPEVILLGNEAGVAEISQELGLYYLPEVDRNEYGTPTIQGLFNIAQISAKNSVLMYTNADIIFLSDVMSAIEKVSAQFEEYLIVGQRHNFDIPAPINFANPNWETGLKELVVQQGKLEADCAIDYFIFTKNLWSEIPPFAVGRAAWDIAMVYRALAAGKPVIDATQVITAIHQNHNYGHLSGGQTQAWKGIEAQRNHELAGGAFPKGMGYGGIGYISDATWKLTPSGLVKNTPRIAVQPTQSHSQGTVPNLNSNNPDQTIAQCYEALKTKPNSADIYKTLGNAFQAKGQGEEAIRAYTKAIQLKPDFAEAHANLGSMAYFQNQLDKAIACYYQAIQLNPNLAGVYLNMSVVLKQQGREQEAGYYQDKAIALQPELAKTQTR
ncbi:tetratricopeptide repeat protein [Oscillatoriales cyanobacterium LEGE 11467]|uniref:Tetratricopeptide repeat protein n=1 Tax=Zarconia navalis LEGE 11467 TaxID=1828826 RepID=A0A928VWI1_9CYAN|nr:tetratricopeptide repeat protein [Zarconia navalis]MBE9039448.1 tetratricopeptide repeat protein [Zarconia navalis LEGE 11467]